MCVTVTLPTLRLAMVLTPATSTPPLASIALVDVTTPALTTIPPARTLIPVLAVTIPTESILVTSSYVNVPPMETLPTISKSPLTV